MKRIFLLLPPVLLLFSCNKGNDLPREETIIKGSKWGIEIGSSPATVYSQLQELDKEKDLTNIAVVSRQSFSNPQQIQLLIPFYQALTLQDTTTPVIDRVIIQFIGDTVNSISAGGAMPEEITQWPQNVSDELAIHKNDLVTAIYPKLAALYQMPAYNSHKIIMPDKPLIKPFDPDIANYDEWGFSMTEDVRSGITGTSSVRLFFKNGKLIKIQDVYNETRVYN